MKNYPEMDEEYDATGLQLTHEMEDYLRVSAKWAKIVAIIGFVSVGFMLLGSFSLMAMAPLFEEMNEMPFSTVYQLISYFVFAVIPIFPLVYLYRFASNMQVALISDIPDPLAKSFRNLKSHYKSIGILTLVIIGLYFLAFIGLIFWQV